MLQGEFPAHLSKIRFCSAGTIYFVYSNSRYIINDIFDITADEVNKPNSVYIEKKIS